MFLSDEDVWLDPARDELHHLGLEPSGSEATDTDSTSTYDPVASGVVQDRVQTEAPGADSDPDWELIRTAWPTLSEPMRAGILAMVRASAPTL